MGFGKQLKNVLEEIDMSVAALSRETGIASTTLYSIIDRDTDNVGLDKVKKIEKAVNAIPGGIIYNLLLLKPCFLIIILYFIHFLHSVFSMYRCAFRYSHIFLVSFQYQKTGGYAPPV